MAEQDIGRLWSELGKQLPLGNYDTALHICTKRMCLDMVFDHVVII